MDRQQLTMLGVGLGAALMYAFDPDRGKLFAWKSVEGASVANAGIVRFDRNDDGTTRLEVKLSYNPPGGAMGHALAALLGADPKRQMDEDLVRMKTLIETGNPPHDAARPEDTRLREAVVY